MPWGAGVSPGEGTGGSSFNPDLTMDFSPYHISLCLRLPSVKCSYTCPCLVMRELQGQLRCLIPKQEKSQEETPLSVIQEGVVVLVSLMSSLGQRRYAKLMIILHIQVGAPCLPFLSLFTKG